MSRRYFGTDGIRGLANSPPMTSEIALKVGMAAGKLFSNGDAPASRRDRQGHAAVGLHDRVGADVGLHGRRHGRVPAGADADAGRRHAHALAARRPRRDDLRLAQSLRRQRHQALRPRRLQALRRGRAADRGADGRHDRASCWRPPTASAAPSAIESAQERYIEFAKRTLPRNIRLNDLRVVIDCANGAGYQVAPDALWELGAEVIKIGVEPNGRNINHKCGSTAPEALCDKVREMRADIGIALDGDADRVVIVDEKGQHRRRRPDHGRDRRELAPARQAGGRRRGGDGHVEPGARALPEGPRPRAGAHAGRRPLRRRAHAQARLQRRRRAVRATSCCPISPPRATAWSRRCRCCPWWSAPASR